MREQISLKLPSPHKAQREVLKAFEYKRFITLCCGRRFGKSLICSVISTITLYSRPEQFVAYITPTYSLGKFFFNELLKTLPAVTIKSANISDLKIELLNGSTLTFFTGERLDALRSRRFHLVIVDEAAFIPNLEDGWKNSIRATLTDYKGKALFVSTPRGKDYFFALTSVEKDDWQNFHFSTYDNPHIDVEEINSAKESLPDSVFQQEYLAVAGENSSAVVALKYITENTIKELSTKPTVVFGIDVAKYTDWTVITGLDADGNMSYFDRFQTPNEITKQRIKALPASTLKVMDSTHGSLGDGIYESLINDGVSNLQGFEFTGASKPKLIMEMVLAIEKGELKFNEKTADELSTFEYTYSSTGHIKYNAINGCHDDCVAALAIANKYRKQVAVNDTYLSRIAFF